MKMLLTYACSLVGAKALKESQVDFKPAHELSRTDALLESILIMGFTLLVFVSISTITRHVFFRGDRGEDDMSRFIEHFVIVYTLITADQKLEDRIRRVIA